MQLKQFQKEDYARLAIPSGGILAHDPGLGKTWAAILWCLLKAGWQVAPCATQGARGAEQRSAGIEITLQRACLLVVPGDLHDQFAAEAWEHFRVRIVRLDSQETFLRLSSLTADGRRTLPPGLYITSYTQLGSNGVGRFPDPATADPMVLLEFLGHTLDDVRAAFCGGGVALDALGYYKLLGVARHASAKEIQTAWRALCRKHHPDALGEVSESKRRAAEETMKQINAAYETLSNPDRRERYNRSGGEAKGTGQGARSMEHRAGSGEPGLVKANRTFDELTAKEQREIIREFCAEKIARFSEHAGDWGHQRWFGLRDEQRARRATPCLHARCVAWPSLADLCSESFHAVAVDEGTKIKGGFETFIGSGVLQMNPPHRLVLSATPIKNRVPDVFPLLWWSTGGQLEAHARLPFALNDRPDFAATFCVSERNLSAEARNRKSSGSNRRFVKLTPQVCNVHKIWKLQAPSILRRRKKDIGMEIVPKTRHLIRVPMGTAQAEAYQRHLKWSPVDCNGLPATGVKLQALRMVAACPHSSAHLPKGAGKFWHPKLAVTLQLIEQILRRGEQFIVFAPFHDALDSISRCLTQAGVRHLVLDGRLSQKKRAELAALFKQGAKGGVPGLLAGQECMAEGHSFHLCNNIIQYSYPWALDKVIQAEDRAHRLNSVKAVNAYRLICDGSIDRTMESQIDEKHDAAEMVLDGHLLGERKDELNMADLLRIAAAEFNEKTKTIPESALEQEWATLRTRLGEAMKQWGSGATGKGHGAQGKEQGTQGAGTPCSRHHAPCTWRGEAVKAAAEVKRTGADVPQPSARRPVATNWREAYKARLLAPAAA